MVLGVNFDHGKSCKSTVRDRRVHFDHHKACRRPVEVCKVFLTTIKHLGVLYRFWESILITTNRVGIL